jgi:hypothetical protein
MPTPKAHRAEIARVLNEVWGRVGAEPVREVYDLLRTGAGEEQVLELLATLQERLTGRVPNDREALVPTSRALFTIGVKPRTRGWRKRTMGEDVCTICEAAVEFCWTCTCGFHICQPCLDENRWGMTCNNVTWECPDCGAFRGF